MGRFTRRHVLTIAGVLLLVALLIPPWVAVRGATAGYSSGGAWGNRRPDPGYRASLGWHLVFVAPQYPGVSVEVDWSRLTLEILFVGIATALAVYALPPTPEPSGPSGSA